MFFTNPWVSEYMIYRLFRTTILVVTELIAICYSHASFITLVQGSVVQNNACRVFLVVGEKRSEFITFLGEKLLIPFSSLLQCINNIICWLLKRDNIFFSFSRVLLLNPASLQFPWVGILAPLKGYGPDFMARKSF